MYVTVIEQEGFEWIRLAQNRNVCRAVRPFQPIILLHKKINWSVWSPSCLLVSQILLFESTEYYEIWYVRYFCYVTESLAKPYVSVLYNAHKFCKHAKF